MVNNRSIAVRGKRMKNSKGIFDHLDWVDHNWEMDVHHTAQRNNQGGEQSLVIETG